MKPTDTLNIPVSFSGAEPLVSIPLRVLTYEEKPSVETPLLKLNTSHSRCGLTSFVWAHDDVCEIRRRISSGSFSRIHIVAGRCGEPFLAQECEVGA